MSELRREELSGDPPAPPLRRRRRKGPEGPVRPPRRWLRRLTFLLAGGLATTSAGLGFLATESGEQWLLRRLDAVLKEETGLGIRAVRLEMHPLEQRVVIRGLELGDGLLTARSVEAQFSLGSLVAGRPRIHRIFVEAPVIWVDKARLDQIKLPKRASTGPSTWMLGRVVVEDGQFRAGDGAWSPFYASGAFRFDGYGPGVGQLDGTLVVDEGEVRGPGGQEPMTLSTRVRLSDAKVQAEGHLLVGDAHLGWKGAFLRAAGSIEAEARLAADLAPVQRFLRKDLGLGGKVEARGEFHGRPATGWWEARVDGRDLAVRGVPVPQGELHLEAKGRRDAVEVPVLAWRSEGGALDGKLSWKAREGVQAQLQARALDLRPLAQWLRVEPLAPARLDLDLEVQLPETPTPDLRALKATARGRFLHGGESAGSLQARVEGGRVAIDAFDLQLPDLGLDLEGGLTLGPRALLGAHGQGKVRVDASAVATTLRAWNVATLKGPKDAAEEPTVRALPMAGQTTASATVSWSTAKGLVLEGQGEVLGARWERSQVDRLTTQVSLVGSDLHLKDIRLEKGEGRGAADLWLTWADLPEGSSKFDLCANAYRLPVSEGLKAADLDPEVIRVEGLGSGWVRLWGPYRDLRLIGHGMAEQAQVYGLTLPAAEGDIDLAIGPSLMTLKNLRVADGPAGLRDPGSGSLLNLEGHLVMDLAGGTWFGRMAGGVDSALLGIGGPRLQAQMDVRLEGPWTSPAGPLALPNLRGEFRRVRCFFGDQSLEGLEGTVVTDRGELSARLGFTGRRDSLVEVHGWDQPQGLVLAVDVDVDRERADTAHLASRLTRDLLKDLELQGRFHGLWAKEDGLRWRGRLDTFQASLAGSQMTLSRPAHLEGDLEAANLQLEVASMEEGEEARQGAVLALEGQLPLRRAGSLGLVVRGGMDLASLKRIGDSVLPGGGPSLLRDLRPEGQAQVGLHLGGTPLDPRLDGSLLLKNGSFRVRGYQQSAEALSGEVRFQGRRMYIAESEPLTGRLASGRLRAWGEAAWRPEGLGDYRISAELKDFQFRDLPEGFELDGSLQATLARTEGAQERLTGVLDARRMLYRNELNLADFIFSSSGVASALDPEDPLDRVGLDIDLRLQRPWQFDTNLLKLQGRPQGAFKVKGTLARPGLLGKMELVPGGRLTNLLPAGDLVVERGSISFPTADTFNPVLDLTGRVDVPPFLVNLGIQGTLDQLSFHPTSTPSLRQDEIVALLVNPSLASTVGTLGATTSTQLSNQGLANAGTGLLSQVVIAGFQERLRQTLHLDRVNFSLSSGTGTPETSLTVGWTWNLFDWSTPFTLTQRRVGKAVTLSGGMEWRLGGFVLQLGATRTGNTAPSPSGEVRYTWGAK